MSLLAKLGMGERTRRNFVAILLVAAGGSIIYGLPYFHYDYYEAYAQAYHLTNTQIGVFGSIFILLPASAVAIRMMRQRHFFAAHPADCWGEEPLPQRGYSERERESW